MTGTAQETVILNQADARCPGYTFSRFNPRAASTGSTLGAAGSAGTTESVVFSGPCVVKQIIFEPDSTAGGAVYLRDAGGAGISASAMSISANTVFEGAGMRVGSGLTVVGSAAGVMATILWRPEG